MKKILVVFMSLMLCLFVFTPAAFSDTEDNAIAAVSVTVNPNISVGDNPAAVILSSVQTGDVEGTFVFKVEANMQYVDIQVGASHLYKADDPLSEVAPILVNGSPGVYIDPNSGNGAPLDFLASDDYTINGFPALQTLPGTFESSQNGHFSQDVDVTVTWNQDDHEKPQGDYSGFVQFYCMMVGE